MEPNREPIRLTEISEKVVDKIPQWPPGWYTEVTERIGVDQYGRQWRSFHSRLVREKDEEEKDNDV